MSIKQGTRTFVDYLSKFETWFPRTGWFNVDFYNCLKTGMNQDYITHLFYFSTVADTYDKVKKYGQKIDLLKAKLAVNSGKFISQSNLTLSTLHTKDPNAMNIDTAWTADISAARFDDMFQEIKDPEKVKKKHRQFLQSRCRVCSSKNHKVDRAHEDTDC